MNSPIYTGSMIAENHEEECYATMLHKSMDFSRIIVCLKQVKENKKRKHTRAGKRSRQDQKVLSRRSRKEIRDNPRFKKGLYNQEG